MTFANQLWLTTGVVVGGLHAASLWLAARRASALLAATGLLRLLAVAAILFGAAFAGGLLPACVGWGAGFMVVAVFCFVRGKKP
jgi:hypothetical protein